MTIIAMLLILTFNIVVQSQEVKLETNQIVIMQSRLPPMSLSAGSSLGVRPACPPQECQGILQGLSNSNLYQIKQPGPIHLST